jgi:hypothetical protein
VLSHEVCRDSQEVVAKFAGKGVSGGRWWLFAATENHEADVMDFEDPGKEFNGKSCKAVFVGNHNFADLSGEHGTQKGTQPLALPVEARADVGDELVAGVGCLQDRFLALKIGFLVRG